MFCGFPKNLVSSISQKRKLRDSEGSQGPRSHSSLVSELVAACSLGTQDSTRLLIFMLPANRFVTTSIKNRVHLDMFGKGVCVGGQQVD